MRLINDKKDILVFLLGLTACFPFRILGTFYVIEIIAILFFPFLPWQKCIKTKGIRTLITFGILWLTGAIIADYINETSIISSLKGWFNIIFFLLLIPLAYWILYDKPQRWLCFLIGESISSIIAFYYVTSIEMDEFEFAIWELYAWKQLIIVIASCLYFFGKKRLSYIIFICWGIYALYNSSRNQFLISAITVCILYITDHNKSNDIEEKITHFKRKFIGVLLSVLIVGIFINNTYEYLAYNGKLGEEAYNKYIIQKIESGGNILLGGRGEVFTALNFITKNPLLGYGSYPIAGNQHLQKRYDTVEFTYNLDISKQIPAHSHIVGFWLWHGILGLLFWIYILYLIWKIFQSGKFIYEDKLIALCIVTMCETTWNIIFSPMGQRMPLILFIIFMIIISQKYNTKAKYKL